MQRGEGTPVIRHHMEALKSLFFTAPRERPFHFFCIACMGVQGAPSTVPYFCLVIFFFSKCHIDLFFDMRLSDCQRLFCSCICPERLI